jgi:hypothetical protein
MLRTKAKLLTSAGSEAEVDAKLKFQCPAHLLQSLHVTLKVVEAVKKSRQFKTATVTFNFIIKTSTTWTKLNQISKDKLFM